MIDIKKARLEKGMTQRELAKRVGVVPQQISNIELGYNMPSVQTAMLIGKELGINWVLIFDDAPERKAASQ